MHNLNWDDLRLFLAVAHAGQIGRAAQSLRIDATTLGRRLKRLEHQLETTLFERTREGQTLTEAGEALLGKAEAMAAAAGAINEAASPGRGLSGTLRISVSEGFGSQFLTPYLERFAGTHPRLTVELVANSGFLSPSRREADIAVMLSRPKTGPVICRKLADYRLRLFAARDYIARHGHPESPVDLAENHTLISYVPDLLYAPELKYLEDFGVRADSRIRSSSINAQHRLIAHGAGVGVLPCFIAEPAADLVPVFPQVSITRTFWLVTHRDTHSLARIKAGRDWLLECVRDGRDRLAGLPDQPSPNLPAPASGG